MKLSPLVIHAGIMIPRATALFSDALAVASIVVTAGGNTVLTTSAAHGIPVSSNTAVSITDADTPNTISAAGVNADGSIVLTTQYPHNLTTTPDPNLFDPYNTVVKLVGFTSGLINGTRELLAAPDRTTLVIQPGGAVASVTLTGSERLLERLEYDVVGWHNATAATTTTLTFPTPASVSRSYTVANPVVVTNIRVYGALDADTALSHLTMDNAEAVLDRPHMFILPIPVRAKMEVDLITAGSSARGILDDGFTILVFIPSQKNAAHVRAIDMAQGQIFRAVLDTFHGLRIQRAELNGNGDLVATFESHNGAVTKSRAIYAHEYVFAAPAEMTQADMISPFDWTLLDDAALDAGDVPDTIGSVGAPAYRDLDVVGILHHGHPSPLAATYRMDD